MGKAGRSRWSWLIVPAVALLGLATMPTSSAAPQPARGPDIELTGTVRNRHGESYTDNVVREVDEELVLDTGYAPVPLENLPGGERRIGQELRVRGHMEGKTFVAEANGTTATGGGAAVALNSGTKNVGVILFNFTNDTSQPWTPAAVRGVVFDNAGSVNAYYQDTSDGQMSMAGDVLGWYSIPMDNTGCNWSGWATAARNAATGAGVNLSGYQYLVYAFPYTGSCGWAGLGYLPGSGAWINGSMNLRVVAHELGHNFGVHHASSESCSDASGARVTLSSTCSSSEYGDPFTVMGSASTRLHHNWHRAEFGWIGNTTISTSGDYALAPADSTGSPYPRLLRIPRSDGTYFQFEYRQPTGVFDNFSVGDPAVNGITIRIAPDPATVVQSQLLDATPETDTFADAPLPVGRSFVDPATGKNITTKSVSAAGAVITVTLVPDASAPTTPSNLTAAPKSTSSIGLSWTASSDNVGVAGYRITRNGALLTTTTATTFTDSGLAPATTYSYGVVAFDSNNNASAPAQASTTTLASDTSPPSTPTNVRAVAAKSGVTVTWTRSTDNVGVAGYRVYRSGVLVSTVTGASASDKPRKGSGTLTYTVVAYDAAGNVSPSSTGSSVKV